MIEYKKNYFEYKDCRGKITGLINSGSWREINLVETKENAIRGDHYHKKTKELFIILEGEIEISLQKVKNGIKYGEIKNETVKKNDVFIIKSNVNHKFKIKKKSKWINCISIEEE